MQDAIFQVIDRILASFSKENKVKTSRLNYEYRKGKYPHDKHIAEQVKYSSAKVLI